MDRLPGLFGHPVCDCTNMFISPPFVSADETMAENLTLWLQVREIGLLAAGHGEMSCDDFLGHKDPRRLLKDLSQWPLRSLFFELSSLSSLPPFQLPGDGIHELLGL